MRIFWTIVALVGLGWIGSELMVKEDTSRMPPGLAGVEVYESSPHDSIAIGDTVRNPSWWWATVRNPGGIRSGNNYFSYGDIGGVSSGGILTAKVIYGDSVLVELSGVGMPYGTPLPDGAIFMVSAEALRGMTRVCGRPCPHHPA